MMAYRLATTQCLAVMIMLEDAVLGLSKQVPAEAGVLLEHLAPRLRLAMVRASAAVYIISDDFRVGVRYAITIRSTWPILCFQYTVACLFCLLPSPCSVDARTLLRRCRCQNWKRQTLCTRTLLICRSHVSLDK